MLVIDLWNYKYYILTKNDVAAKSYILANKVIAGQPGISLQ